MSEWQDIATAPRDGSIFWLGKPGHMRLGFWADGVGHENHGTVGGGWIDHALAEAGGVRGLRFAPTHWHARPSPPIARRAE